MEPRKSFKHNEMAVEYIDYKKFIRSCFIIEQPNCENQRKVNADKKVKRIYKQKRKLKSEP